MERDVLAYITPDKITDWKRLTLTRRPRPEYVYGSGDPDKFKEVVGPGTRLWVIACAEGWSPVLVARITVIGAGARMSPKLELSKGLRRHYRAFR